MSFTRLTILSASNNVGLGSVLFNSNLGATSNRKICDPS